MQRTGCTPDPLDSLVGETISSGTIGSPDDKRPRVEQTAPALAVVVGPKVEQLPPPTRTERAPSAVSSPASSLAMSEARLRLAEAEHELELAECRMRAQAVNVHKEHFNVEV